MAFDLGFKAIRRLCEDQQSLVWHKSKLSEQLFRGPEKDVFAFVDQHVRKYHALPKIETLTQMFPVMAAVQAPEPSKYYVEKLENAFCYSVINQANIDSQAVLKADQNAHEEAREILRTADRRITQQLYRTKIMDLGLEAPKAVLSEYHGVGKTENICWFGWPFMDDQSGGIVPGDVVSFVGRPAQGKSWMMLQIALHNWRVFKKNVLFVSMEMNPLSIAQRVTTMYASVPYGQLKKSAFSSSTYKKFESSMLSFKQEQAKFYCVDGNLAATIEEIYDLADLLDCDLVDIDGAYLCRHPNPRLDRFTRVAENVRLMKQLSSEVSTFASWQFARSAVKGKSKDKGQTSEKAGMEDIGMSDEIPQVSSIVLAMDQEDSVETLLQRRIRVLKGRSGEIGGFNINWGFDTMDFSQYVEPDAQTPMAHI